MPAERPLIAVFGSSTAQEGDTAYRLAYQLGRELARAGADVMTGGYRGTMEACSRGAHEEGGHVVGITVELFEKRGVANRWVKERIHTRHLYDRLRHLVERAAGFVALPGSIGTLTEVFLTWTLLSVEGRPRVPLVLLGDHWRNFLVALEHPDMVPGFLFDYVEVARTPQEAVERLGVRRAGAASLPGESERP